MVNVTIKKPPTNGPTYGIRFSKAHKKAITTAFLIPKIINNGVNDKQD